MMMMMMMIAFQLIADHPPECVYLITRQDKTNVYCNYGSQEAGLVKHTLHKMNSIGIWDTIKIRDIKCTLYNTQFTT